MISDISGSRLIRCIPILEHKLHKHAPNQKSKSLKRITFSNIYMIVFWISCATKEKQRCFILNRECTDFMPGGSIHVFTNIL